MSGANGPTRRRRTTPTSAKAATDSRCAHATYTDACPRATRSSSTYCRRGTAPFGRTWSTRCSLLDSSTPLPAPGAGASNSRIAGSKPPSPNERSKSDRRTRRTSAAAQHPARSHRRAPQTYRRTHRRRFRRRHRAVRRPRRLHHARPVRRRRPARCAAQRPVLTLRRARPRTRRREDQDDWRCLHGRLRTARRTARSRNRRRSHGAGHVRGHGPVQPRAGDGLAGAHRPQLGPRRGRRDRHAQVYLRPLGRHGQHGRTHGEPRRAGARARLRVDVGADRGQLRSRGARRDPGQRQGPDGDLPAVLATDAHFTPRCMNRFLPFIALVFLAPLALAQTSVGPLTEVGQPFMRHYPPTEYEGGDLNISTVQGPDGVMYFANTGGLIIYDSVSWQLLRLPGGDGALSLALDDEGVVYVGGLSDLGYLAPDAQGELGFVSLLDRVPEHVSEAGYFRGMYPTNEGVYFVTGNHLVFIPTTGPTRTWTPGDFDQLFFINEQLYVSDGVHLKRVLADGPEAVPYLSLPDWIVLVTPRGDEGLLVVTTHGVYAYAEERVVPVPTEADAFMAQNTVTSAAALADGSLVIGTFEGGLVRIDGQGRLVQKLDRSNGLGDDTVFHLYPDRNQSLWVGTNGGITRVEVLSPLTRFDATSGVPSFTLDMVRHLGDVYVAGLLGIARLRPSTPEQPGAHFEQIYGDLVSLSLVSLGANLLSATTGGVFDLRGDAAVPVEDLDVSSLHHSKADTHQVLVVTDSTLASIRYDPSREQWEPIQTVAELDGAISQVAEDPHGDVWVAFQPGSPSGVARVLRGQDRSTAVEPYGPDEGLPAGDVALLPLDQDLLFNTTSGLLRFDYDQKRFVPDSTFGPAFAQGRSTMGRATRTADGVWSTVQEDGDDESEEIARFAPRSDGGFDLVEVPWLRRLPSVYLRSVYTDTTAAESDVVWLGVDSHIYRYETSSTAPPAPGLPLVRRVTSGDSLVYGGSGSDAQASTLAYSKDVLRFEYALPFFDVPERTRYQIKLSGFDDEWSAWTDEARKDYTNLGVGDYTFRVRALTVYGAESDEASFTFTIEPPWYLTAWAFAAYALLALAVIYAAARAWGWRLERQNRQLEAIVTERTSELSESNAELAVTNAENERLLLNILPGPIAERLKTSDEPISDAFGDVTVLFSDLVGFTVLSQQVNADRLVYLLNDLFSRYDALAQKLGVEKIKTIGDAYMAVCGLPVERPDHATVATRMALGMFEATDQFNREQGTDLQVRIGLNSGPVVAGVIGTHKFIYDLWGDTVNTAARMESHGVPGRVHVSESTWAQIAGSFEAEARGAIQVKGKGQMETYLLEPIPSAADAQGTPSHPNTPNA